MIAAQPRHSYAPTDEAEDEAAEDGAPSADTTDDSSDAGETGAAEAPDSVVRAERYGDSLGKAFALAVTNASRQERDMRKGTAERRLNLLTRQSLDGLHRHLPASALYLRGLGVPVDWAQLLDDLIAWPRHSGQISRRWLQDFYRICGEADRPSAGGADEPQAQQPEAAPGT
jgi:CRISPR system Cascade subunit CasB